MGAGPRKLGDLFSNLINRMPREAGDTLWEQRGMDV